MTRKILVTVGAVALILLGGGAWFFVREYVSPPSSGNVLGADTAPDVFWDAGQLVRDGGSDGTIVVVTGEHGDLEVKRTNVDAVTAAVASPDGTLFVARKPAGENTTVWAYRQGDFPAPLYSTLGTVIALRVSPNEHSVSSLEQRALGTTELYVFHLATKSRNRVADGVTAAVWDPSSRALIARTAEGTLMYVGFNQDGHPLPADDLGRSYADPAVISATGVVLAMVDQENGTALVRHDLVTHAVTTIAPLPLFYDGRPATIRIDASGERAIILLPRAAALENSSVYDVRLHDGTLTQLPIVATDVQWMDASTLLVESIEATQRTLSTFSFGIDSLVPVGDGTSLQLL